MAQKQIESLNEIEGEGENGRLRVVELEKGQKNDYKKQRNEQNQAIKKAEAAEKKNKIEARQAGRFQREGKPQMVRSKKVAIKKPEKKQEVD